MRLRYDSDMFAIFMLIEESGYTYPMPQTPYFDFAFFATGRSQTAHSCGMKRGCIKWISLNHCKWIEWPICMYGLRPHDQLTAGFGTHETPIWAIFGGQRGFLTFIMMTKLLRSAQQSSGECIFVTNRHSLYQSICPLTPSRLGVCQKSTFFQSKKCMLSIYFAVQVFNGQFWYWYFCDGPSIE